MASKLDLNRATTAQIEKLPGISRTLARKIVSERNARGGFTNLTDVHDVVGNDAELIKVLADGTTLGEPAATAATPLQARINLDPDGKNRGHYGGYKANLEFQVKTSIDDQDAIVVSAALAGYFDADGILTLSVPTPKAIVGMVKLSVREPSGGVVATRELASAELEKPIALPITPVAPPTTQPTDAPTFGQPQRLRGRVLDRSGRVQISGRQVIVWAATTAEPTDADFVALASAKTDGSGYFSTSYPLGQFTSAHASVALERAVEAVPIHLSDGGAFPADVILVVDAPAPGLDAGNEDCGCAGKEVAVLSNPDSEDLVNGGFSSDIGQGKCVDFTRPDRTLQEFSYSYVVRTTEPSIKGMTLQEPPKLTPGLWQEVLELSNFNEAKMASETGVGMNLRRLNVAATADDFSPEASLALRVLNKPDKIATGALQELAFSSKYQEIIRAIGKLGVFAPERSRMDCRHAVDWDFEPTIYQACTIAHGHLLHFKQEWIADGYSMGRLLYSLPLAPGQKKQIAVLDWERRESAVRQESLEEEESLTATLSRDRDIGEMVNSVLTESSRGGSSANTSSFGGGLGIGAILGPVGGLLGIGGGASNANSTAWQNSSRNVAANSLQTLRDRTSQAAAAMRAQRSTVIQSIAQGERVSVVTESVANYNHCHAMTMEYFEVLRHLIVRQRLVDVQECLFVPLQMSRFDRAKALRWLNTLQPVMPTRDLREGFNALERIDNNYDGSNLPVGRYADQPLDYVEGELQLRFQLARPRDKDDDFDPVNWGWLAKLIPSLSAEEQYKTFLKDQQFKDRIFLEQLGPRSARAFVDLLRLSWIDENDAEHPLPIDPTLLSNFANDRVLSVSLRLGSALNGIARKSIKFIKIHELALIGGVYIPLLDVLPATSRVIV
ncbi:MAG TPA: helix-hairpin-helix domain-containing protein, partial [Spongiibacteraceae bacterium]|nr:helix-hairpin-helix domain-containing protein [Spongiibacteraceae bacterium]